MANIVLECCDLCEQPMQIKGKGKEELKGGKNGFTYEIGYSNGGWGRRENLGQWKGEICNNCYAEASEAGKVFMGKISELRNNKGRKGDNLQPMQRDEPSPQRRRIPFLCKV